MAVQCAAMYLCRALRQFALHGQQVATSGRASDSMRSAHSIIRASDVAERDLGQSAYSSAFTARSAGDSSPMLHSRMGLN